MPPRAAVVCNELYCVFLVLVLLLFQVVVFTRFVVFRVRLPCWQKEFIQKEIFNNMEGKKPSSYIATVSDTLCLLKQSNDVEHRRKSPSSFLCNFRSYTISLATSEAAGSVALLNRYGAARIANDVILGLDRRNILVPCYEPDRAGTRLLHFRL